MTRAVVIGGGPAGLMAAEVLCQGGVATDLYDAMPSLGRKFLMAGKGGLNLTHSEALPAFLDRYGPRREDAARWLEVLGPEDLRTWAAELGVETFVGSSGRVFPREMKAAPLLRAWLHRLRGAGLRIHVRHRWQGWEGDALLFDTPEGVVRVQADAVVLALGGGSWARLGSDGRWVGLLADRGVPVVPLRPANCGFEIAWSEHFRERHAGAAVKTVAAGLAETNGHIAWRRGEFVITRHGVEGSLIYALAASLRDRIEAKGRAVLHLDLLPDRQADWVLREAARPRGARSLSSHLQSRLGLTGVKAGLLREALTPESMADLPRLAAAIKALPLTLTAARPLDEAISTAGGVALEGLAPDLMIQALPGMFCAGEMLDWEAPTGGYLLTASFASGYVAGRGALAWLAAVP
jgi:uncharacterized flavoprotein (TIGR03862 family)